MDLLGGFMNKIKIYLAGPDVFLKNASLVLKKKKELCEKYGFIGLSPLDNEIENFENGKRATGTIIKFANQDLIKQSDVIIANLNSFRGFEPDSGTCFECGYADALGKLVYGYTSGSTLNMISRYQKYGHAISSSENITTDELGNSIENFGFPLNLMIAGGNNLIFSTFEDCLEDLYQKRLTLK